MAWLHYWRMPLLLFISGAGSYFALGFRSPQSFVSERFKRLFIPLLIGMFLIVPPQIYYEKIAQFRSYADFYPTVFQFIPYPEGNFSWHHLWFILYLLLYSLAGLPLFLYLRSDRSSRLRDRLASLLERKGGLALPLIPFFLVAGALRPFFPEEAHALTDDWAYFAHYGLFFLYGQLACSEPRIWAAIRSQYRLYLLIAVLSLIPFYFAYHVRIGFLWDSSRILVGLVVGYCDHWVGTALPQL